MALTAGGRHQGWSASIVNGGMVVSLSGDWSAERDGIDCDAPERILAMGGVGLSFDCADLGHWDSGLIIFLAGLRDHAGGRAIDCRALPEAAQRLLALVPPQTAATAPAITSSLLLAVGRWAIGIGKEVRTLASLIGATCLSIGGLAGLSMRLSLRGANLAATMLEAGPAALPIVGIVNLLVGGIVAFVGAIQLRRFSADIYITNLVGMTMVREMTPLMTAIIMAGRTGGAYAATIATMQANEEIDALRALGIPVFDYLILPRVLALSTMMPILYLYGCAIGIFGGLVVAALTLDISASSYLTGTRAALSLDQFAFGLVKSLAFGALIALMACQIGLRAGRSAAEVGRSATKAVVAGIIGVIALDAAFALCANALGL